MMSNKTKEKKEEKKERLWFILNQEEAFVALALAKTESGALARFEIASGLTRESYRAEPVSFKYNCALTTQAQ